MAFITEDSNDELFQGVGARQRAKVEQLGTTLADAINTRHEAVAVEDALKGKLRPLAKQAYFEANETTPSVNHTYDFAGLQVNFNDAYVIKDAAHYSKIVALLGNNHPLVEEIWHSTVVISDVTDLSTGDFIEYAQELKKLNKKYGVEADVEDVYTTSEEFHTLRHELLTAEDNEALDKVLPLNVSFTLIE